jgi:hypothetical protein
LVEVKEEIAIAGAKDETGAELEGILAQAMLAMSGSTGTRAGSRIITAKKVEEVGGFQGSSLVGSLVGVDQKRESDASFLAEEGGVVHVGESDGREGGSGLCELRCVFAQLRDKVAAKDSAVVA